MVIAGSPPPLPHEGLLLMGGQSSRFLPDKMQEILAGKPLHMYGLDALASCCPAIWVSTGRSGAKAPELRSAPAAVRVVPDDQPGQGPLEGIRSVLARSQADHLLVLAGDLPRIQPATLLRLLEAPAADVVCARDASNGRLQPLCGRWSASLLDLLTQSLQEGQRGVQRFLSTCHVLTIDVSSHELHNVNRPSDLP